MKKFLPLLLFLSFSLFAEEWVKLENCRLIENRYNDGDSFLVESPEPFKSRAVNRFRLYFVDTAETSSNSPFMRKRLDYQAEYWGHDDTARTLETGRRAKLAVREKLHGVFTVYTWGEQAKTKGMPRYFVMVRVGGQWLSEWLVEQGRVRIYGMPTDLPDGTTGEEYIQHLEKLEKTARREKRNAWSISP